MSGCGASTSNSSSCDHTAIANQTIDATTFGSKKKPQLRGATPTLLPKSLDQGSLQRS
jgi:hypothetical protein